MGTLVSFKTCWLTAQPGFHHRWSGNELIPPENMGSHICTGRALLSLLSYRNLFSFSADINLLCLVRNVRFCTTSFFPLLLASPNSSLHTKGLTGKAIGLLNSLCIQMLMMGILALYELVGKQEWCFSTILCFKSLQAFWNACFPNHVSFWCWCVNIRKGKHWWKINFENQTKVSAIHFTENPGCFPSINSVSV